jgi:nucleotide-binding universal stress UspA family protein
LKGILVALDFSKNGSNVVEQAESLAKASSTPLWLLHVGAPEPDMFGKQLVRKVVSAADVPDHLKEDWDRLHAVAAELRDRGLDAEPVFVRGTAVECILEEARLRDVEIIVMGAHGRGSLFRALVGSVSEGVLRGSTRPVLIVPMGES